MLKIVYFDYQGVLDRRSFTGLLETLATAAKSSDHAGFVGGLQAFGYAYATGQIRPPDFWPVIAKEYGEAVAQAGKNYALHVDPIRDMWFLLNTLHERYDLGLFADIAVDKKEVVRHGFDLPTYFDHLIFSCDVGLTKQDTSMYRLMDQGGQYAPSDCLVVDADERNVALASTLGYAAHLFTDPATFSKFILSV